MTRMVCIGECIVGMAPLESPDTYRMGFACAFQ
jgi:hypothetical protein